MLHQILVTPTASGGQGGRGRGRVVLPQAIRVLRRLLLRAAGDMIKAIIIIIINNQNANVNTATNNSITNNDKTTNYMYVRRRGATPRAPPRAQRPPPSPRLAPRPS